MAPGAGISQKENALLEKERGKGEGKGEKPLPLPSLNRRALAGTRFPE